MNEHHLQPHLDIAIGRIIEEHYQSIYQHALNLTKNASDAEDLTQIACVRFCVYIRAQPATLDKLSKPDAYIKRIVKNTFINLRRCKKNTVSTESLEQINIPSGAGNGTSFKEPLYDKSPQPDEQAQINEKVHFIEGEIAALSKLEQDVIQLFSESWKAPAIAKRLNIPVVQVRAIRFRARKQILEKIVMAEKQGEYQ